jgi:hypothetical protein
MAAAGPEHLRRDAPAAGRPAAARLPGLASVLRDLADRPDALEPAQVGGAAPLDIRASKLVQCPHGSDGAPADVYAAHAPRAPRRRRGSVGDRPGGPPGGGSDPSDLDASDPRGSRSP